MSVRVKYNGKSFNLKHTIIEEIMIKDYLDHFIIHHPNGNHCR